MEAIRTQISKCCAAAKLVEHKPIPENKQTLIKECEVLYKLLSNPKLSHTKHILSYGHYTELRLINNIMRMDNKSYRSVIDRLFNKIFKGFPFKVKWMSMLFKEFIRGITFFGPHGKHNDGDVVYHRPESCHYKNKIGLLHCTGDNKEWANSVQKCLIERLIYDKLYAEEVLFFPAIGTEESVVQDDGHSNMLDDIRGRFHVCFPNVKDIKVDVNYKDFKYPVELTIEIKYKDGTCLRDTYTKTLTYTSLNSGYLIYSSKVHCERTETRRRVVQKYTKIQSYRKEETWKALDEPGKEPHYLMMKRSASVGG
jgi:hypothetical protein